MNSSEATTALVAGSDNINLSWSASTNCTIASGSILSCITVESSLSPLEEGDEDVAKSPLILYPSSPACSPPEITITFAQIHEVRQVYLRSTARNYEMYYAEKDGDSNEYLSTVRCGPAVREGGVLQAVGVEEIVLCHQRRSRPESASEGLRNGMTSSTYEDDWIDVKGLDNSQAGSGSLHSSNECDTASCRPPQDLHEASAEISHANPCMSLTLKLLSLVNKGCICIDELYVFADPVDAYDSVNEPNVTENSCSNSLLTMLMPAIMQISKSSSLGQDIKRADDGKNKSVVKEQVDLINSRSADVSTNEAEISQGVTQEFVLRGDTILPSIPASQDTDKQDKTVLNPSESILNDLVLRVNRIEAILLRFEDKMLKPISDIDQRLQHVENKLDYLTKWSETRRPISCTRITAPEFSSDESESISFYNTGVSDFIYETNNQPSASYVSSEIHCAEAVNEAFEQKSHLCSIDDAMVAAIAGFLTSVSSTSDCDNALKETAISTESKSSSHSTSSHKSECVTEDPIHDFHVPGEENGHETLYDQSFSLYEDNNDKSTQEIIDGREETYKCDGDNPALPGDVVVDCAPNELKDIVDSSSGTTQENISIDGGGFHLMAVDFSTKPKDVIEDIIGFKSSDSTPDYFGTSLLEVKFIPQESMNLKSSLEVLLSASSGLNVEPSSVDGGGNGEVDRSDSKDLVSTEDWCTSKNNLFTVDMDYCNLNNTNGESFEVTSDYCFSTETMISTGSLI